MLDKPRVLIAEDNAALREVVRFNLLHAGYEVLTVANGQEALKVLQREHFDLIITDQQMPEMTGYELCERLVQDPKHAGTPIVMLTAKGFELDLPHLSRELGVREVVVKPFSPQQLVQTVHNCLAASMPHS